MQTDQVTTLLQDVSAEVIEPRFRALTADQISEKNPGDLVTVADQESEQILTERLSAAYPGALIVGEEATATDPGLITAVAQAEHCFTVDPVDGTKNFVHGRDNFAVMVAELRRGEPVRSWIWQPVHRVAWVAERGAGVFRNGERIEALPRSPRYRGATSNPRQHGEYGDGATRLQDTAWCCGVDYGWLLEGRVDYLVYYSGKPWDHAPGLLMVRETGGVARLPDGSPYRPGIDLARLLVAASPQVWDEVRPLLAPLYEKR